MKLAERLTRPAPQLRYVRWLITTRVSASTVKRAADPEVTAKAGCMDQLIACPAQCPRQHRKSNESKHVCFAGASIACVFREYEHQQQACTVLSGEYNM